jgi:hypothetical protein
VFVCSYLFRRGKPAPLLELALRSTLGGWEGPGSVDAVIEPYLLRRYDISAFVTFEPRKLTFAATGPTAGKTFELCVAPATGSGDSRTLESLKDVMFDVAVDRGLDGVILTHVPGTDALHFNVHALQVKTGEHGKTITPGGPEAAKRRTDSTMIGIVAKSKVGAAAFRADVFAVFDAAKATRPTLTFVSFTLITTKELTVDAKDIYVRSSVNFGDDNVFIDAVTTSECFDLMEPGVRNTVLSTIT